MNQDQPRERFLCPRTGQINLSDGGYLVDPEGPWGESLNRDIIAAHKVSATPCLAILGEPGIGKSTTLQAIKANVEAEVVGADSTVLWFNLRAYQSDSRLVNEIFHSDEFRDWRSGTHRLNLFLDSLDEGLLRIGVLTALLSEELARCPVERLSLRIACRTAVWPTTFERALTKLWGEDSCGVYELAPLRRVDVAEIAVEESIDPEHFMQELDRLEIVPLAIKPVTLRFLLNEYKRSSHLPKTQADAYRRGCRLLCDEPSDERRDSGLHGALSVDQRLAVAEHIAALTIFGNKASIWTGIDRGDIAEEDTTVASLSSGVNGNEAFSVGLSESVIRETLHTGLFSSRGSQRLGWAHLSYAEFLAACYIDHHQMALPQILSILYQQEGQASRLVPQLFETAAWLSGMRRDVFGAILASDPEVLLLSDVASVHEGDRAALVDALLRSYQEGSVPHLGHDAQQHYAKLVHPYLGDQLRPYISDLSKDFYARRTAIAIAAACREIQVLDCLVSLALDVSDENPLRVDAARAIASIGENGTKLKLLPIVQLEPRDDPDNELLGVVLSSVWPIRGINIDDLLEVLHQPRENLIGGAYDRFLSRTCVESLQPHELPAALAWVSRQPQRLVMPFPLQRFMNAILARAWEMIDYPDVLESLADAVWIRSRWYEPILDDPASRTGRIDLDSCGHRRVLLETIVERHAESIAGLRLLSYQSSFVRNEDLSWMIECLLRADFEQLRRAWATVIRHASDPAEPDSVNAILVACERSTILSEEFGHPLRPWDLSSEEAEKARVQYRRMQEIIGSPPTYQSRLEPPPDVRILALLDRFESGELDAWWILNREMTLHEASTHYQANDELEPDLARLPGWQAVDDLAKFRIVCAAKRYVLDGEPRVAEWLGTNTLYRPAYAGYRALRLLLREDPGFIRTLPAEAWQRWAPIILVYPEQPDIEHANDAVAQRDLVCRCYQVAPQEMIDTLLTEIDKEDGELGHLFVTRKVDDCCDRRLANALYNRVREGGLQAGSWGDLMEFLLRKGWEDARILALSTLQGPTPFTPEVRPLAVTAAQALVNHVPDADWAAVWTLILNDTDFGRDVVLEASRDNISWISKLNDSQLADLYVWTTDVFPNAGYSYSGGIVGPNERAADLQHTILRHLTGRGTFSACEALKGMMSRLPHSDRLRWALHEGETNARRNAWTPLCFSDLPRLASDSRSRLVRNGNELLEVIIDSLARLQARLYGETPAAIFLWNETREKTFFPKDESVLSDFVKLHLEDDLTRRGVVIKREVEVRRAPAVSPGERTDIHVNALFSQSGAEEFESIRCIIEVKGNWHRDLNSAMQDQLAERYLRDSGCRHGLYLVGWFESRSWDMNDLRLKAIPASGIEASRQTFKRQADDLTRGDRTIRSFVLDFGLNRGAG